MTSAQFADFCRTRAPKSYDTLAVLWIFPTSFARSMSGRPYSQAQRAMLLGSSSEMSDHATSRTGARPFDVPDSVDKVSGLLPALGIPEGTGSGPEPAAAQRYQRRDLAPARKPALRSSAHA